MHAPQIAILCFVLSSLSTGFCCNPVERRARKPRPDCEDIFRGKMEDVRVPTSTPTSLQCAVNSELLSNGSAKLYFLLLYPYGKRALYQLIAPQPETTEPYPYSAYSKPVVHNQTLDSGYSLFNFSFSGVSNIYWIECAMWLIQPGIVVAQRAYVGTYPREFAFDHLRSNIRGVVASPGDTATFHCRLSHAVNLSATLPPTDYIAWDHKQRTVWGWGPDFTKKPPNRDRYVATYDRAQRTATLQILNVQPRDAGPVNCFVRHQDYTEEWRGSVDDFLTVGRSRLAVVTSVGLDPWEEVMEEGQNCRVVDGYEWMFTRQPFGPFMEWIDGEEMFH